MTTVKSKLSFKTLSKRFSDKSLTKKASLNALAAALDYGARLVTGFLLNPLLLVGLGDYLYGVWQILGRLINVISAASGRPTQTLKLTIANQQASTNYEEKRRNVGSALIVWFLFLPLLTMIGGVLAWFAPVWLNTPESFVWVVRLAAGLLVADLIATNLVDVPESVLRGENLGYKRMGLTTFLVFVQAGVIATALYFETGIVGVGVAILIDTLLTGALFLMIVRSYVPWFGIARPSMAEVRRFFGLSWWFLTWRLIIQLITASDVVVLGMLNSVEQVTIYTLTKYTPEALISLVAIVVSGVTPGLGGMIGLRNLQKAARVRSEIMAGTWLIATAVGATILLWNRSFVQLWVGAEYYAGAVPAVLIMLMVTQFVLIRNDANIIDLTLDLRHKVFMGICSAGISLAGAAVLVGPLDLGIPGLCLGLMAGRSILSLGYPWIVGRFLQVSLAAQLKSVLKPAFVTILLFMLALSAGDFFRSDTWIGLILSVGMTLPVVSLLAFYGGLSGDQRRRIMQRVQAVTRSAAED
jgi:O-antigen/teichoic acid export membrane protein